MHQANTYMHHELFMHERMYDVCVPSVFSSRSNALHPVSSLSNKALWWLASSCCSHCCKKTGVNISIFVYFEPEPAHTLHALFLSMHSQTGLKKTKTLRTKFQYVWACKFINHAQNTTRETDARHAYTENIQGMADIQEARARGGGEKERERARQAYLE